MAKKPTPHPLNAFRMISLQDNVCITAEWSRPSITPKVRLQLGRDGEISYTDLFGGEAEALGKALLFFAKKAHEAAKAAEKAGKKEKK